ncbi:CPC_1213 family protein [Caproiciproducens sp.]|nr:CPC_1213 family protein [Caproiciproducens sp.]
MNNTQKNKKSGNDKKQASKDKKQIKHDPQDESARAKFGKSRQQENGN